ncbi:GNAT family N-acetyltransferase [Tellurirhabdus rosea]|uniref:GNAT family N-acetyltransferase n=1 Tax=Tellurirhabdus rosea TaxID=2674997 RepID=UPI0022580F66|nr:GNAT family N-acetyltransferase [Tellurirhabdus rosea]
MRGSQLDLYLSYGYFRMHQNIFTCRIVCFDEAFYSVHWLRIVLADVVYGKKQQQVLKANSRFSVRVQPFVLTDEMEELYARYRASVNFDAPLSVESWLYDGDRYTTFDTQLVEVRDGTRLIAGGIFDCGYDSIAGIMNFYDPDYRKFSLGKYLMLQKIEYARQQQKAYYYPGYLIHRYPKFDYKLFACEAATEVFDEATNQWLPFDWAIVEMHSEGILND